VFKLDNAIGYVTTVHIRPQLENMFKKGHRDAVKEQLGTEALAIDAYTYDSFFFLQRLRFLGLFDDYFCHCLVLGNEKLANCSALGEKLSEEAKILAAKKAQVISVHSLHHSP
jgi:hypothetical protein